VAIFVHKLWCQIWNSSYLMLAGIAGLLYLNVTPVQLQVLQYKRQDLKPLLALIFLWKLSSSIYYVLALGGSAWLFYSTITPDTFETDSPWVPETGLTRRRRETLCLFRRNWTLILEFLPCSLATDWATDN
jgi:hypothetical protein